MSFATAVRTGFSKYADFTGRAARPEFWWWYLFTVLATFIPMFIGMAFLLAGSAGSPDGSGGVGAVIGIIFYVIAGLITLALLVPTYAVGCRRLHDRGTSGWLQLLILVPCGNIVLLVFWLLAGTPADNQYGPPVS